MLVLYRVKVVSHTSKMVPFEELGIWGPASFLLPSPAESHDFNPSPADLPNPCPSALSSPPLPTQPRETQYLLPGQPRGEAAAAQRVLLIFKTKSQPFFPLHLPLPLEPHFLQDCPLPLAL